MNIESDVYLWFDDLGIALVCMTFAFDYRTKQRGCVFAMLPALGLPGHEDGHRDFQLVFLYRVVEGSVPTMPPHDFIIPQRTSKRHNSREVLLAVFPVTS